MADRFMRILILVMLLFATPTAIVADDQDKIDFFEARIRPVLVQHCYACHSRQAKSLKGNLRLDSLEGMLKGGDSGPAIDPGNPDESLIISALGYEDFKMPPKGKLQNSLIDSFRVWLKDGAIVPESFQAADPVIAAEIDWDSAREHWAFQPFDSTIPAVQNERWSQNPIDHFILARLEAAGLTPPKLASPVNRLRRLSFSLTGLPPAERTILENQESLSQTAYLKLAESLLQTRQYGERWGRHWLDVARYADSNGADENKPYPLAWRYRNYVIDSFNRDTPFDQFILEQLAGDLIPDPRDLETANRYITATTFLALGIKIDAEQDSEKKRADIVDEQIDTIGRTFLGMTIACARCHDHKFDPIPTDDYYALAGVLRSTDLTTRELANPAAVPLLKQKADTEQRIKELTTTAGFELGKEGLTQSASYLAILPMAYRHWKGQISPEFLINLDASNKNPQSAAEFAKGISDNLITFIEAEDFDRGFAGIETDGYGEEVGIIADKGTNDRIWVEYDYDAVSAGTYQIEFKYAAKESRPGTLKINGEQVSTEALGLTTGGWYPQNQKWHVEGRFEFKAGKNTVAFEVPRLMAHVDKVAIARVEEFNIPFREAEAFDAGNVKPFESEEVTYISDPPTNEGTYFAEYKLIPRASGKQILRIRYAALDSRPMRLIIDGKLVKEDSVSATTGGWTHQFQQWHDDTELDLTAEPHTIRLEREGAVSHIDKIQLVSAAPSEPGEELGAAIEKHKVNPHILIRWIDATNLAIKQMPTLDMFLKGNEKTLPNDLKQSLLSHASENRQAHLNRRAARSELSDEKREQFDTLDNSLTQVNQQLSDAPKIQVMAVTDGNPQDSPVFIRGNHLSHGDVVPRRFLQVIAGENQDPYPTDSSGRLRWARNIISPDNPLTARVIANRVWRWHFGKPLVASTENFGLSGSQPTHPRLLDHLAEYLIQHDWSLKQLHRYIIGSKTFQMASTYSESNADVDPANELYWKWEPRRLEAEAIRDSLLSISGKLDTSIGGAVLQGIATLSPSVEGLAGNRMIYETSQKRSVYLPIVRTNVFEMLTVFDFPNPAAPEGNRATTTVPTQAMYLVNNPVIYGYAKALAQKVMHRDAMDLESKIKWLYLKCYNRMPTDKEVTTTRSFFLRADEAAGDRPDNPLTAWTSVCHSMLLANEFVYLR